MYATELKAIKLIEENTGRPLSDINVSNIFFGLVSKANETHAKIKT